MFSLGLFAVVLLLVALAVILLAAPRGEDGLDRVLRTGMLRVGLDASFPPFEMLDADGEVIGYDADLAAAIARELGVDVEFANIGFDGLYDALQAERVDVVISGLPYDERRTQDVHYSQSYFNAGQVLVVRSGEMRGIGDLEAAKTWLFGEKVAVEWGSMGDMEVRGWQSDGLDLEILAEADASQALAVVESGQARAAVVDAVAAYSYLGDNRTLEILIDITDEPYVIAAANNAPRLARRIDDCLDGLRESGELNALEERWLGW